MPETAQGDAQPAGHIHYQGRMHALQKELITRWYNELHDVWLRQQAQTGADGRAPTTSGGGASAPYGAVGRHDGRASRPEFAPLPGPGATGAVPLMISGNCVELLRAFDLLPVYPEINALQLAIRKQALEYLLKAEEKGYSTDNCGYVKADMAFYLDGAETAQGTRIPKPSLILNNFVGCNTYIKWFEHLAHFSGAPLFTLDIPFLRGEEPDPGQVRYVATQLKELIPLLEKVSGRRFDIDRLREITAMSARAEELWSAIKDTAKNTPSPYEAYFDATTMMGPLYVYRGTADGVRFFEETLREMKEKVSLGVGAVSQERFRVVVEAPPPYPYFKAFRDLFSAWGACSVASTYSCVGGIWEFGFRHDPKDPLGSIARHMLVHNLCNRTYLQRYDQILRYLREWKADALIIHSVKSCRLFSAGHGDMREFFTQNGVPTLYVESDLEDPRYYSPAQMRNRFDAFFEALEHKKYRGAEKGSRS